jgi:hypothetical protein
VADRLESGVIHVANFQTPPKDSQSPTALWTDSNEQAAGVSQVGEAVTQMDQVTRKMLPWSKKWRLPPAV